MKDNVKVGMSVYHATPTKYIIFTICAVVLIQVLHDVIGSLSNCKNVRENASKAIELGGKAYNTYQKVQQPQRFVRQ